MQPPNADRVAHDTARAALVASLSRDINDERVLEVMSRVPREAFVVPELTQSAYEDRPLPIGHGQTTSQPRIIAIMLEELALTGDEQVLEIGTGSGYQTALLAELAAKVVSVELIPSLAETADRNLRELGYVDIETHIAVEELGWPQSGPYDAIVVGAAAPRVPMSLADQLKPGGRLVIPVGSREGQDLLVVRQTAEGLQVTRKGRCGFVPLIGREAFASGE